MTKSVLRNFFAAVIWLLLCSTSVYAMDEGGNSTGGGDIIKSTFVELADAAISRIEQKSQSVVDINLLRTTLAHLKINVVEILYDPKTNFYIPNQRHLYAYTFYDLNLIQLKEESWEAFLKNKQNIDHHIVHELLRAAGYNDDKYQISIGQLHLDLNSTQDTNLSLASSKLKLFSNGKFTNCYVLVNLDYQTYFIKTVLVFGNECGVDIDPQFFETHVMQNYSGQYEESLRIGSNSFTTFVNPERNFDKQPYLTVRFLKQEVSGNGYTTVFFKALQFLVEKD